MVLYCPFFSIISSSLCYEHSHTTPQQHSHSSILEQTKHKQTNRQTNKTDSIDQEFEKVEASFIIFKQKCTQLAVQYIIITIHKNNIHKEHVWTLIALQLGIHQTLYIVTYAAKSRHTNTLMYLGVPQLAGHTQILATPHESIRLG